MRKISEMLDWRKINNYRVIKTCKKGREMYTEFVYNINAKAIGDARHSLQNVG